MGNNGNINFQASNETLEASYPDWTSLLFRIEQDIIFISGYAVRSATASAFDFRLTSTGC